MPLWLPAASLPSCDVLGTLRTFSHSKDPTRGSAEKQKLVRHKQVLWRDSSLALVAACSLLPAFCCQVASPGSQNLTWGSTEQQQLVLGRCGSFACAAARSLLSAIRC